MMAHVIQQTLDGSHTIYIPELDEHYHSTNGAVQEARHIYISKAYNFSTVQNPVIFEVGFGTGLNALLTALEAERTRRKTLYVAIEKYPVSQEEWSILNYPHMIGENSASLFATLHLTEWERIVEVSPYFSLKKIQADITDFLEIPMTDIIYFDAFAPNKQASMWSTEIFNFLFEHTSPNGDFVAKLNGKPLDVNVGVFSRIPELIATATKYFTVKIGDLFFVPLVQVPVSVTIGDVFDVSLQGKQLLTCTVR